MSLTKDEQETLDHFANVSDEIHAILEAVELFGPKIREGTFTKDDVYKLYGVDYDKLESARRSLMKALHEGWGDQDG